MNDKQEFDLLEALHGSLDIHEVLADSYPLIRELASADYGALGISSTGRAEDYEWLVANMPEAFYVVYPELAPYDFVRISVSQRPNVVLRDDDMLPREEIEANVFYRRAHEIGMPIERGMAVMLHVDNRWQSGLALYREGYRPFSDRERSRLQRVTPWLAAAVRNCHLFGAAAARGNAVEGLLDELGAAVVIVDARMHEISCTPAAERLLDAWFSPGERHAGGLPEPLRALLAEAKAQSPVAGSAPLTWTQGDSTKGLEVRCFPLPRALREGAWALALHPLPREAPLPAPWRARLTPRERQITSKVLSGWDNRLIAEDVGCTEATVKKHLQHIFDKLGVDNRAALQALAASTRL